MTLLEFDDVSITYQSRQGPVPAVRNVSLSVEQGETVGVAGESGCGKTTLTSSVLRLLPKTAKVTGEIRLNGDDIMGMTFGQLRAVRWAQAAVVFQGAMHALNPVQRIETQLAEPILLHDDVGTNAATQRVGELLEQVGLPASRARAYPHQLSGGQKQRVMIAMALACKPKLLIADEPTTALDVMVQAQVLDLLSSLVADLGLGVVFISHDLSVLAATCDRVAVMYAGRIVEQGSASDVFTGRCTPTRGPSRPRSPASATRSSAMRLPVCPVIRPSPATCQRVVRSTRAVRRPKTSCTTSEPLLERYGERDAACHRAGRYSYDGGDGSRYDAARNSWHRSRVPHPGWCGRPGGRRRRSGPSAKARSSHLSAKAVQGKRHWREPFSACSGRPSGAVYIAGEALSYRARDLKAYRRRAQLILQDPSGALNPRHTVYEAVAEGLRVHGLHDGEEAKVADALSRAGLRPPERFYLRYPHELSGGQRQRVVIAGALVLDPKSSSPTNRFRASTHRFGGRSSPCCCDCATNWLDFGWSSRMTSAWPGTSPTGWLSCTSAASSRSARPR